MEDTEPRAAHCLLRNWVEERATVSLDGAPSAPETTKQGQDHRYGHKGILSTQLLADMAESTTHRDSYQGLDLANRRQHTGLREEQLWRCLYHQFSQDIIDELISQAEMKVPESTTRRDYQVEGFMAQTPASSKKHAYHTEQAVTFWTENVHGITGVSDVRTSDSPFKKSSAFTMPMSHYLDQPIPHDLENYPNM
ncbi:hypothetical protein GDO78_018131 [Eleutherodactylus coqui]|uniref:Sperm-associated antigen 8 n=2 Tax=Eleutherodactylus coqui TaxID=57060 RepID=A0A8J6B7L2_ELECQ|nr:hypothetical protein GDO78_018131 [Eleutherodactylus coqui]